MTAEQQKVQRAIASGNPLWMIVDGISEDENLTGAEQSALIAYAESLSAS